MLCPYCQQARTPDTSACHNCGAPAPGAFSSDQQEQAAAPEVPQFSFDTVSNTSQTPPFQAAPLPTQETPSTPPTEQLAGQQDPTAQSMLPALYQENASMPPTNRQPTVALQLIPQEMIEPLLPAQTEAPAEIFTVPPTYTNPRPLIPRRRAINGLLSVLIVCLLICGGLGYALQSSGVLNGLTQFFTGTRPLTNLKPSPTAVIPDPPADETGPAANTIPSALLGDRIAKNGNLQYIPLGTREFKPGQTIYLEATFTPPADGTVTVKWYMNKQPQPYQIAPPQNVKKAEGTRNIIASTAYAVAASGYVELYWNDQLAQRLHFAVR